MIQKNKNIDLYYFQQPFISLEIQKYIEQECKYKQNIYRNQNLLSIYNKSDYKQKIST